MPTRNLPDTLQELLDTTMTIKEEDVERIFPRLSDYRTTYPESRIYVKNMVFKRATLTFMSRWKLLGAWRGTNDERAVKYTKLLHGLCPIYGIPQVTVVPNGDVNAPEGSSGSSSYNQRSHTITLNGKWSIITALHEFAHARGFGEEYAVLWSNSLFKKIFPAEFGRMGSRAHMAVMDRAVHTTRMPAGSWEKIIPPCYTLSAIKGSIGAPHNVIAGCGISGDLYTGEIAKKLMGNLDARATTVSCVIATNMRRKDIPVNAVTDTPISKKVFEKYIGMMETLKKVVEIHGFAGVMGEKQIQIATKGVTKEQAKKLKAAFGTIDIELLISPIDDIYYRASASFRNGTMSRAKKGLNIEISSTVRKRMVRGTYLPNLTDLLKKFFSFTNTQATAQSGIRAIASAKRVKVKGHKRRN